MPLIGLIRERKDPPDTRVAFTPAQCAKLQKENPEIRFIVEPSPNRCFTNEEYLAAGITLSGDLSQADLLMGIKEVPVEDLIAGKTYSFFSHTKKKQPYNQKLAQALIHKKIRMIDYECLTHTDGQRILGFGFFAGIVGAHNGLLTYGRKYGAFQLPPAHVLGTIAAIKDAYSSLVLPPLKIVITGSGKVAAGAVEVMNMLDIEYVEPEDYRTHEFEYPVYTHLKGSSLYVPKDGSSYHRDQFHKHPDEFDCIFKPYLSQSDILINGVYWEKRIPRLFEPEDIKSPDLRCTVMADITCDYEGSVSINHGSSTIEVPVYGVDRETNAIAAPYQPFPSVIDVMAVDNLPNELPRDASEHFGIHLEKYILREFLKDDSELLNRATICRNGLLTEPFNYLSDYAY